MLKSNESLSQLDDSDTNVFQKSLIDRYQHRPRQLQSMCLAEFAAKYVVKYGCDDGECDALPASESDTTSTQITLTDGFGKMNKRRVEAVIRFRKKVTLVTGTEPNSCCTTHGAMNRQIC